jgi:hypothetical protein
LRVSDLVLPEGVTTDVDPEAAVAIAHMPRALEPEPEPEAAEVVAGGEQPAASDEG